MPDESKLDLTQRIPWSPEIIEQFRLFQEEEERRRDKLLWVAVATLKRRLASIDLVILAMDIEAQPRPPLATGFVLHMLSRKRRDDILNDLQDWYSDWVELYGTRKAQFLCWWKVGCAMGGSLLDITSRIGDVVGKFTGAK